MKEIVKSSGIEPLEQQQQKRQQSPPEIRTDQQHDLQTSGSQSATDEGITISEMQSEPDVRLSSSDRENSDSFQLDIITLRIYQVLIPVTLCSLYVVVLTRIIDFNVFRQYSPTVLDKTWFHLGLPGGVIGRPSQEGTTAWTNLVNNIIIVSVFFALLVMVTLVILLIFYMEWHACLTYYFYMPSLVIMAIITPAYLKELLLSLNWLGLDLITMAILNWNFTALGMMTIFNIYVSGPLCLQQAYLIHNSGLLAVLMLSVLPGWAPWMLLGFLVAWDLFAVLAPFGPLNLIINMAEREGVIDMPGLIYTTDTREPGKDEGGISRRKLHASGGQASTTQPNQHVTPMLPSASRVSTELTAAGQQEPNQLQTIESDPIAAGAASGFKTLKQTSMKVQSEVMDSAKAIDNANRDSTNVDDHQVSNSSKKRRPIEERGINIGLGDFIFYGLLIGLTSKGRDLADFYMTLATLEAILVGVMLTLVILVTTRQALPALPISIALGLLTAALTGRVVAEFSNRLAAEQIFI